MSDLDRAQRWHYTDHGASTMIVPPYLAMPWLVCTTCNPKYNPERPNPYWQDAKDTLVSMMVSRTAAAKRPAPSPAADPPP
jgi:hypothetical protein